MPDTRYAVFYTPPPGAFADFGAKWLGWDIAAGRPKPHPHVPGLPRTVAQITAAARPYGFHATLRPPFRLAPDMSADALCATLAVLCTQSAPVPLSGLRVDQIGRFLALTPSGGSSAVNALAGYLLRGLDGFRAPLSEAELAHRRAAGLIARQEQHLLDWGYPFVLADFRFYLTLTGPLGSSEAQTVRHLLTPLVARVLPSSLRIEDVTLVAEDPDGRFRSLQRFRLTDNAAPADGSVGQSRAFS